MLLTVGEFGPESVFDTIAANKSKKAAILKKPSSLAKIEMMGFIVSMKFHSNIFNKLLVDIRPSHAPWTIEFVGVQNEIVATTCDLFRKILPAFKCFPLRMLTLLNRCHIYLFQLKVLVFIRNPVTLLGSL